MTRTCSTCTSPATATYFDAGPFGAGTFYGCADHAPSDSDPIQPNPRSQTMTEQEIIQAATAAGTSAGTAAGSWVVDGNTSEDSLRSILAAFDDCAWDHYPAPLSGEWAGESIPEIIDNAGLDHESLTDDQEATFCEAYEEFFFAAYENEATRSALAFLGEA